MSSTSASWTWALSQYHAGVFISTVCTLTYQGYSEPNLSHEGMLVGDFCIAQLTSRGTPQQDDAQLSPFVVVSYNRAACDHCCSSFDIKGHEQEGTGNSLTKARIHSRPGRYPCFHDPLSQLSEHVSQGPPVWGIISLSYASHKECHCTR